MDNIARPPSETAGLTAPLAAPANPPVAATPPPRPAPRPLLDRAIRLMDGAGAVLRSERERLESLGQRLEGGTLNLAVLGQFKRGKSTLVNALLGEAVLPSSVVPLTAIPTFIRAGAALGARVFRKDRTDPEEYAASGAADLRDFLARFVTETGNPKNRLGISHVEVLHPSPLLKKGVALIDTPGIGSTLRHNTEATLNFLPQCDAALFLVSPDPPITETEIDFLRQVRDRVPRLFFLLNKVDLLSAEEREESLRFLRNVLREQAGTDGSPEIFCVSARLALRSRLENDAILRAQSGLPQAETYLTDFLAREKTAALEEAIFRKAASVVGDALLRLRLTIRSLKMPAEELQQKLEILGRAIREIGQERISAGDLLAGGRKRLLESLEEHAEQLRRESRKHLRAAVQEALAGDVNRALREDVLREALARAIPGFFEHEMGRATEAFARQTTESLRPHQERLDLRIHSVRRTAAELFDIPCHAPDSAGAFRIFDQPYWVTHDWTFALQPISETLIDRVVTRDLRRRRILRRVHDQIEALVIRNVENLRWSIHQSLNRAFERFQNELDARIEETVAATQGAVEAALKRRLEQSESVADEVRRLEAAEEGLAEVGIDLKLHEGDGDRGSPRKERLP